MHNDLVNWLATMLVDEGCIVICPHPEQFKRFERDFIEGIRRIPARIYNKPGTNPFEFAGRPDGQWVLAYIPRRD